MGLVNLFYGDLVIKQKMITGMKRIHDYIMLAIVAFASVGCTEEIIDPNGPAAETEKEVQFGLSLGKGLDTRTIYGQQSGNAFPIYWVDEDKVTVYSPQCLKDRNLAEYKVEVATSDQNFVNTLTKTGDFGVQWGSDAADFYSIYPSGDYNISEDGTKIQNLRIGYTQDVYLEPDGITLKNMSDCLMYAKTNSAVTPGNTVNLTYKPIATAIMVELGVAELSPVQSFTIQSVKLTAPTGTNIAGNFNVNLVDGSYELGTVSNSITLQVSNSATGGFYVLTYGKDIQLPIFILPIEGLNMDKDQSVSTDNWIIEVVTDQKTFKKTLSGENLAIEPGQVHKLTLPKLTTAATTWDPNDWMTHIPRNVYLSEVSIPGSWNSINPDFQDVGSTDAQTIANQYSQGVRAFHLDTRWKASYSLGGYGTFQSILGLGVADGGSNGGSWSGTITQGDKYMKGSDTPLVEDIISQLVGYIKNTPQEYMILVCSFAQESINHEGSNGYWYGEISAICNKSDYADYIVDATKVTANTLVGDVLGKILVIINMQGTISATTELPSGSKCMFVNMPSELTSTRFTPLDNQETLLKNNTDYLWYSATTATSTGISMYNNQAQITSSTGSAITNHNRGYVPSISQRSTVLNSIVDWSRSNYGTENYAHDKWIYLGLGGYQVAEGENAGAVSGSYSTIASTYNTWIDGKVTEMGTIPTGQTVKVPYYPVGIVLMNFVNDYASTVKNILMLNNAYRLQYDPNKPSDYNPNATPQSAAASYSSGMKDSDVAAFGWD